MKYFRLLDDVHVPRRWHLGELFERGTEVPMELLDGALVPQGVRPWVEVEHQGIPLDFCLTSFAVPVATTKLGNAIERIAGSDLQRLPLLMPDHEGFEALNVTRRIKCLDETRTEFTKWTKKDHRPDLAGQYHVVRGLKLHSDQIPKDAHFFRIEGWSVGLVISEPVKIAMEACGCLGAKFQDVT